MKISLKRQRGAVTFVEALGVMIVASLLMPSVWGWLSDDADNKVNLATADHDKQVVQAAAQYIKDNYATVLASATASTPATITVPMLQSQYPQLFATGFSANNPYQQTVTVRAYQTTPGSLDTLIVTSGGQMMSERNMRKISQLVGGAGGYISATNPNVANGTYGAWGPKTVPNSPGAGHMVYSLMFQNGSLVSDYLYRKSVPGHPELNQMNTAIDMGANNVNNAATVNAQQIAASGVSVATTTGVESVNLGAGSVAHYDAINQVYSQSDNGTVIANHNGSGYAPLYAGTTTANGNLQVTGSATINGNTTMGANTGIFNSATQYIETGNGSTLYLKPWTAGTTVVGGGGGSGNLQATGTITANNVVTSAGNGVQVGSSYFYGDGSNSAIRQNGMLYVQQQNGAGATNVSANDYYIAAIGQWASQLVPSGTICGMASNGGSAGNWCQGYNPYTGCPPGYQQQGFRVNFGDGYMYWCTKA